MKWRVLVKDVVFINTLMICNQNLQRNTKLYGVLTIDWVFGGCGKGTPRSKKIEKGNRSTKHLFSFLSFVL